jgi:hypothetical protein
MEEKVLIGQGQEIHEISLETWKQGLAQVPQHIQSRLSFMTNAHHQIRYFVVKEMAITQKPIKPEFISERLNMPLGLVQSILEELERKLFFLVRNDHGAVSWAFPITVETTPHKIDFSSGEHLYAA